nr:MULTISPECIES: B12-binding domain-containing protein [unclassified Nannocystis]
MAPSEAARTVLATDDETAVAARVEADNDELAVQRILEAVDHFDPDRIEAAVKSSLFLGPAVTVFERVFSPALVQIGERWAQGSVSVAQEHLAAEILGNTMRFLLRLVQPEHARRQVVLACFADEEHTGPLYGVGLRLATWSIKSIVLGARTPPEAMRHMIDQLHPDIVGLSATVTPAPDRLQVLLDGYAEACGSTPWIVGGIAAEAMREPILARGGHIAPTTREQLHELIQNLCPLESATGD